MGFGRLVRNFLDLGLGLPLKTVDSQHEYSAYIRHNLQFIAEVARQNLGCSRNRYGKSDSLQNDRWAPLAPGHSVWLCCSQHWKFVKRWIGPCQIISH